MAENRRTMDVLSSNAYTESVSRINSDVLVYQGAQQRECQTSIIPVAAYCRVSTDLEIQKSSLELQMHTYRQLIDAHPGWELAGIYADEGISGTSTKHRVRFNQMIEDAKAGKIKYILAKSISRFARNTVDMLKTVRELKEIGVGVYFEKERIDTMQLQSEFVLTMFAAAAQEDIMTLSANMKVGIRMRFEAGRPQWYKVYGYVRGETSNKKEEPEWLINEEQAKVIRRIFKMYLDGVSFIEIRDILSKEQIPSPDSKGKWSESTVSHILHNEKYIGDLLMQKTYTADPITHKVVQNNNAAVKQYYRSNHHPAIVEKQTFKDAQRVLIMKDKHYGLLQYPYYGFLFCPICGAKMVRFSIHTAEYQNVWTCGGFGPEQERKKRTACPPYLISEKNINKAVWDSLRSIRLSDLQDKAGTVQFGELAEEMLSLQRKAPWRNNQSIEYSFLKRFISRIIFPKWHEMRIDWNIGISTTVSLPYAKVSEYPYIDVHKGQHGYVCEPPLAMNERTFECIKRRRAYCNRLRIVDVPILAPYIPDEEGIPHVFLTDE